MRRFHKKCFKPSLMELGELIAETVATSEHECEWCRLHPKANITPINKDTRYVLLVTIEELDASVDAYCLKRCNRTLEGKRDLKECLGKSCQTAIRLDNLAFSREMEWINYKRMKLTSLLEPTAISRNYPLEKEEWR